MNKQLLEIMKTRNGSNSLQIGRLIDKLGTHISDLAISEEDYNNIDFFSDITDSDIEYFANVPGNPGISEDDVEEGETYYRYTGHLQDNSRDFCIKLINRTANRVFSRKDIFDLNTANPGFGQKGAAAYNVFEWRGGSNCNHTWVKYKYKNGQLKKTFIQPNQPDV